MRRGELVLGIRLDPGRTGSQKSFNYLRQNQSLRKKKRRKSDEDYLYISVLIWSVSFRQGLEISYHPMFRLKV